MIIPSPLNYNCSIDKFPSTCKLILSAVINILLLSYLIRVKSKLLPISYYNFEIVCLTLGIVIKSPTFNFLMTNSGLSKCSLKNKSLWL